MLNEKCSFHIQHFTFNIPRSLLLFSRPLGLEANGVWWPPRSSKPLFRRGSVEGLVRFRHASAKKGRRQKAEGRRQKAEGRRQKAEGRRQKCWRYTTLGAERSTSAFCPLPSALLFGSVRQKPDLHRAAFVGGVHRLHCAIE